MKVSLHRETFISNFLKPIVSIGGEKCCLNLEKNKIKTVFANPESTLFCSFEFDIEYDGEPAQWNLASVSKLIQILSVISDDNVTLEYEPDDNKIKYKSKTAKFNMHLLDPSVILQKNFNFQRLIDLNYVSKFTINLTYFKSLSKIIQFSQDVSKVYLTSNGQNVECEFTDKTKANIDSFSTGLSDNFIGTPIDSFCFELDVIKKLQSLIKHDINVSISTNKVIFFEYEEPNVCKLKFATTSLKG